MVFQPMPKPATWGEYLAVRDRMIDTHGRALISAWCARCRAFHFTVEPCYAEIACPTCGSRAARCRRPSEHEAPAWHHERKE